MRDAQRGGLPGHARRSRRASRPPRVDRLALAREPELHLHGRLRARPDEPRHLVERGARAVGARGRAARSRRRRPRARRARRRGLLLGLRLEVRRLRHQAAHRAARGRRGARPRGRGHRGRRHARPLLAGLHRRLGVRAGLVHGAGRRHDQGNGPRRGRRHAPRASSSTASGRRARSTTSAATPTARPRSSSSRGCARTRPAGSAGRAGPPHRDDRHDRHLRRPSHHLRHERRRGPPRLAGPVRGEPRGALRRRGPPLHDRAGEHVGLRTRARP